MTRKSEISNWLVGVYFKVLGFSEKMECDVYGEVYMSIYGPKANF